MIPYILLFISVFLLNFKIEKNNWRFYDYLLLLILCAFSAIRYGIGSDYFLYKNIFLSSYNIGNIATNRSGVGFSYLCNFLYTHGMSYEFLIFICSVLTVTSVYIFIKRFSNKPGIAILAYISLGFYTSSFNGFRQYLALSLLLIGFLCLKEKKYFITIIAFLIAYYIHTSSIIGIAAYLFFYIFKNVKLKFSIMFIVFLVLSSLYNIVFFKIVSFFPEYSRYITYDSKAAIGTYMVVLIYFLITLILILPRRKKIENSNEYSNEFINYLIIAISLMLFQLKNYLFARIIIYFTIFTPILISEYFYNSNVKKDKIKEILIYIILFTHYIIYISSFGGVIPYNTIFTL